METITILNKKGGVGKTSCTCHLAGALSLMGKRVLLIDNDPQASLSQGFYGSMAVADFDSADTVAALYEGFRPFPSAIIRNTGFERIDLVPGSDSANDYNVSNPEAASMDQQHCIRDFLETVAREDQYDFVLIDCPPNLLLASYAALAASDYLLVPLQPEEYGAQGLMHVQDLYDSVRAGVNPRLDLLGYLLTMVARIKIHEITEQKLRTYYQGQVFNAMIPASPVYKEAISFRKPVGMYKPKGAPAAKFTAVAEEILARIASRTQSVPPLVEVA